MNRAELGRAAWRVLHLMTLRYPDVSLAFISVPGEIRMDTPN